MDALRKSLISCWRTLDQVIYFPYDQLVCAHHHRIVIRVFLLLHALLLYPLPPPLASSLRRGRRILFPSGAAPPTSISHFPTKMNGGILPGGGSDAARPLIFHLPHRQWSESLAAFPWRIQYGRKLGGRLSRPACKIIGEERRRGEMPYRHLFPRCAPCVYFIAYRVFAK